MINGSYTHCFCSLAKMYFWEVNYEAKYNKLYNNFVIVLCLNMYRIEGKCSLRGNCSPDRPSTADGVSSIFFIVALLWKRIEPRFVSHQQFWFERAVRRKIMLTFMSVLNFHTSWNLCLDFLLFYCIRQATEKKILLNLILSGDERIQHFVVCGQILWKISRWLCGVPRAIVITASLG